MPINRVLIVDDDADDRTFFIDALSEINPYLVCDAASNGKEALDKLSSVPHPHIIFLDLNMPVMNGFECLAEIRNREPLNEIPVIIFTTTSDTNTIRKSYDLGASAYFKKPNDFPSIITKLRSVLSTDFLNSLKTGFSTQGFTI